ncbi:MAG: hypothetical protein WC788_08255 [Candidatus Paceibacterota bacterium]|jgi:hypothetical protein
MKKEKEIPKTAIFHPEVARALIKKKADGMDSMLEKFQVTNNDELNAVSDKIKQVKSLKKYIEQEKDKYVDPAKQIIAEAKEQYDPYIKKCQNAEIILKDRAKKYMIEQDQKRIEAEKKIAARVEKGTLKTETAIKKIEALPETQTTIRTDKGSGLRMSKRKIAVIKNPELIPDAYWIIDEVRVRRDALAKDKAGEAQIPGVEIQEEADLSSINSRQ